MARQSNAFKICLTWLVLAVLRTHQQSLSLALQTPTINTNSLYTFQLYDENLQNYDGILKLTFPVADYPSLTTVTTVYTSGNTSSTYPFSVSGAVLSITYIRGTLPGKFISFVVDAVKNPGSVKSVSIVYTFTNTTQLSTTSVTFASFAAGSLSACSVTFSPATTHTVAVATLAVTVTNSIASGGSIIITYPSSWANPSSASYPPVTSDSITCTKISGSLTTSISCLAIGNAIDVTSVFSSAISALASFSFSMNNIRTPPTTSSANKITVTTVSAAGNEIDKSTTCAVTAVSAQTLTLSTTSSFTIGETQELALSWTTYSPLIVGDSIKITIPTNYMSFQSLTSLLIFAGSSIVFFSVGSVTDSQVRTLTFDTLPSGLTEIPSGTVISVSGMYVKCLLDTSPRTIQVNVLRNTFGVASGTISVTPSANALTSVTLSSDLTVVSSPMTFTIVLTTKNAVKAGSTLTVTFPSTIQYVSAPSPTCSISSSTHSSSISGSTTCTYDSGLLKLTVSNFLSTDLLTSVTLTLTITGLLTNPLTTEPTAVFTIATVSSAGYTIDRSTDKTYTATAGTIGSLTISRESTVVGASNAYTFLYTMTRTLKLGATVTIILPSEITTSTSPSYSYSVNGGASSSITPTRTTDANSLINLQFVGMVTSNLAAGSTISIKIDKLVNPLSMKTSSSFSISSKHSGYLIESIATGKTISNTQMSAFTEVIQAVYEPTNGKSQDYNLYIKPLIPLYTSSKLFLDIVDATSGVNELSFVTPITGCRIYKGATIIQNVCLLVGSRLTVTLGGNLDDVTGVTQYQLVVEQVKMARTMAATSTLTLSAYTSDGYGISTQTLTGVRTTFENKIQTLSLSISNNPSKLNQVQAFTISFTGFNGLYLLQGDYAVITIPESYTYIGGASPTICTTALYTCSFYNGDNHSIKVAPSGSYSSVTLRSSFAVGIATGLYTSPTTFSYSSDYFYVTTYATGGSIIDETLPEDTSTSTAATFYRTCGGFCQTCLSSNTSNCLTCYSVSGSITFDGYNYLTSDNNCVDECGDNYYNNSGICTPCQSPCYGCDAHELDCTSCLTGYFFDPTETAENSSCKVACPSSYYGDNSTNICKLCNSQCAECAGTSILCTACASGKYLYNSECRTVCPDGYYEDTSTNKCLACSISCNGCDVNATDCLACANNYYQSGSECVSSCPVGSVINNASGLCECLGECATCEVQLTRCTSCSNTSKVLYENSCLSSCPSGSYLPDLATECTTCPFAYCSRCDDSECLVCNSGYFLHLGGCRATCPASYYESSNRCEDCGDGCASCDDGTECLVCSAPYLKQEITCVTACTGSYINFNATECLTVCPIGYSEQSGRCEVDESTDPSSSTTVVTETSTAKVIPFPYSIAFCLIAAVCIAMKCIHSYTLLASAIMSLGSVLEILSAITFVIASYIEFGEMRNSIYVVLIALAANYICNILCMVFIIKILNNDKKFLVIYKKTVCSNIVIRAVTIVFSHKFHQIVFSNLFAARALSNKVEFVGKLFPFNILLVVSMIGTLVCIIGSGITSYSVQSLRMSSATFIWSVDCILVWVLNLIATILVLRRKGSDYENDPDDDQAKRYETQDQFNFNNESCGVDDVFIEQSRVNYARDSKNGQSRKNYFYQNSSKSIGGEDPYQTPLSRKKVNPKNPITNRAKDLEESSEALCIGDKNKSKKRIEEDSNEDIEQIMLQEPVRDNLVNIGRPGERDSPNKNGQPNKAKLNYEGYDLDPHLLEIPENSEEFKKLPAETKSKIRLAKANLQINKNSKNVNKNHMNQDTIDPEQLDEIQLSPKKNDKDSKKQQGEEGQTPRSQKKSVGKSLSKSKSKDKDRSKSKSKSKEKNLVKTKGKGSGLSPRQKGINDEDIDLDIVPIEQSPSHRLKRNRSEQMNQKDLKQANKIGTKSQNIKKKGKGKNMIGDVNVNYPSDGEEGNNDIIKQVRSGSDNDLDQQQPSLPIFKHNTKREDRYGSESDGLEIIQQKDNQEKGKKGKGKKAHQNRRSETNLHQNRNRLKGRDGNNQMQEPDRDQIPHLHTSQQLGSLIINRNQSTNKKSDVHGLSNDDESIYNKIYKDETETLRSVQGDNFFGQDISPSQFNIQNQRFQDTEISSNDMPIKPFITQDFEDPDYQAPDDGFEGVPEIRRYGSTKNNLNIDYDLVREKRQDNDRIKELQKIYLPRLEVRAPPPRKKK